MSFADQHNNNNQMEHDSTMDALAALRASLPAFVPRGRVVTSPMPSFTADFELHADQPLGDGLSGTVYACTRRRDGRRCAVKFLPCTETARTEMSIHQQCAAAAPDAVVDVVAVYDEETLDLPRVPGALRRVLVLEYMPHGDLFTLLSNNRGPLSEQVTAQVMVSAGRALASMHAMAISHRDIKLENFMVVRHADGHVSVKLTDFGFAKRGCGLTTPLGTGYYLAPEIVRASRERRQQRMPGMAPPTSNFVYDKSCDMWSLGVCMFMLLGNYAPFRTNIPNVPLNREMRDRIVAGDWDFRPAHKWAHISDASKDLIRRMLVVDPEARLSAAALARHPALRNLAGLNDDTDGTADDGDDANRTKPTRFGLTLAIDTPAFRFMQQRRAMQKQMESGMSAADASNKRLSAVMEVDSSQDSSSSSAGNICNSPS